MFPIHCRGGDHLVLTPRLLLRPAVARDVSALVKSVDDPTALYWYGWEGLTNEELLEKVVLSIAEFRYPTLWVYAFSIVERATEEVIGLRTIYRIGSKPFGLGSWIREDRRGQGFGSENLAASLFFIHQHLGEELVRTTTAPNNAPALGQFRSAGMVPAAGTESAHIGADITIQAPAFEHSEPGHAQCQDYQEAR